MTQPSLFDGPVRRPKKRGHVPRSSVEAYQTVKAETRADAVVTWLRQCYRPWMTSAELATWRWLTTNHYGPVSTDCLLYVRRGLSDALRMGLVEKGTPRRCAVSGRTCDVWKVACR